MILFSKMKSKAANCLRIKVEFAEAQRRRLVIGLLLIVLHVWFRLKNCGASLMTAVASDRVIFDRGVCFDNCYRIFSVAVKC